MSKAENEDDPTDLASKSLSALLGARIREVRTMRRLTQRELGARIGATSFAIAAYEAGKRSPSVEVVAHLARALEVEAWALLSVIDMWRGRAPKAERPEDKRHRENVERLLGAEEFLERVVEDAQERLVRVRNAMDAAVMLRRHADQAPER